MAEHALETNSPQETEAWAAAFAATLAAGDLLALEGDLGAGKTTLVRGLAKGLGIDPGLVSSPTFALMNEYEGGRLTLVHIDAYRMTGPEELAGLGWDRLLEDPSVVIALEWPSRVEGSLPPHRTTTIALEHVGDGERSITVTPKRGWATCPTTGRRVPPDSPTWPFVDERAQLADLHGWFAGKHTISRPVDPERDDLSDIPHAPGDEAEPRS
ncbi:MAG: tRNA (adenosine(37)-N6)-threonylcarbamoyltransferase complex ATPase subunit type 1 TsaE [Phycisphaerales bacterium]|jgi:tRNA threonylcarbamoyladenosine biosynthesis protein TsaE